MSTSRRAQWLAGSTRSDPGRRSGGACHWRCGAACRRLVSEGLLPASNLAAVYRRLGIIENAGIEVAPSEEVRTLAADAIDRHDLRAADYMQLAAALVLCRERPRGRAFVCFDKKLAIAADNMGFNVLPPV